MENNEEQILDFGTTTIQSIRTMYFYSIIPKAGEFKFLYGDEWRKHYNEAMEKVEPSLTGFIKFFRNSVNTFPNRTIYYKSDQRKWNKQK